MRRIAAAFAFFTPLVGASLAHAQVAVDWQAAIAVGVGVTDNVANTPDAAEGVEDAPVAEADGFANVAPGLELVFETRGATQTLAYGFGLNAYFLHPEATAYSNSLSYGLRAPLSDTVELVLGLGGAQSSVSVFNLAGNAQTTPVDATPGGNDILVTASVSQALSIQASETWSVGQGLGVVASRTLAEEGDGLQTYVVTGTVAFTKEFVRDDLGFDVGTDVQLTPPVGEAAGLYQNAHRAQVTWTHAYSDDWSTSLGAGALVAYRADDPSEIFAHPAGEATLDFQNERGAAALSYAHGAQPNLLLGQLSLTDSVTLRAGVPLGQSGFDLAGSGGYQATRPLLSSGFGPAGHGFLADAALGWIPLDTALRLEVRYQFAKQLAVEVDADADDAIIPVPGLTRQSAMFNVTFAFPGAPQPGGRGPGVVPYPAPTSNPDLLSNRAPTSQRARDERAREEEEQRDERREQLGGDGQ